MTKKDYELIAKVLGDFLQNTLDTKAYITLTDKFGEALAEENEAFSWSHWEEATRAVE